MVKGDIVLIPFPFTNLSATKIRPALVLISNGADVTVTFITTQMEWADDASVKVTPSKLNALKKDSIIRLNKIATIDKSLVLGKIGQLSKDEIDLINVKLKEVLDLM
jgi:mRNA interferase MazF